MGFGDGASRLPSFLLPCTHCGHRMVITAVTRLPLLGAVGSEDLDDVTHSCVACGATLIRTVRHFSGDTHVVANRG
jgi:hypothetical protein